MNKAYELVEVRFNRVKPGDRFHKYWMQDCQNDPCTLFHPNHAIVTVQPDDYYVATAPFTTYSFRVLDISQSYSELDVRLQEFTARDVFGEGDDFDTLVRMTDDLFPSVDQGILMTLWTTYAGVSEGEYGKEGWFEWYLDGVIDVNRLAELLMRSGERE